MLRRVALTLIKIYQWFSHFTPAHCRFYPTCSEYTKRCINNLGVVVGILLGTWRILRCNPLSKGGFDPAPENPFKKRWLI